MRLRSGVFASACLLVEALGVALFLRGFFPVPVRSLPRREARGDPPAEPAPPGPGMVSNWTKIPPPLFKKVVIVLIDALRDDFVFGSKGKQFMPYTTQLVEKGTSYSFIAEAKPPTVTMPRIKALMTGSIPGFIDVIVNLNSPALLDDNLIWQAKTAGKRIIFYGDDTWVKLFPQHFMEYDGTTSFFVSDFTEVDDNVTRHLDRVLKRKDWDLLILHYLGLDHIGHMAGPNSPLVGPKLHEMDNILKKIHISLLSKEEASLPNLLVVCGDHGMSETGSHGGSSEGEVYTPLLFVSSAFEKRSGPLTQPELVQQTDIASTLAVGLGLPISRNSVGNLILPVLGGTTMREQLRFVHLNGFQLSRLLQENTDAYEKDPGYEHFKIAEKSHGNWIRLYLEGNNSEILLNLGKKVLKQYLEALKTLSSSLSKQVAQYDMYSMMVGTVIIIEVLLLLLISVPKALSSQAEFEVPLSPPLFSLLFYLMCLMLCAVHVIVCTSAESLCYFCSMSWLTAVGVMMLISALMCGILSAIAKVSENSTLPLKNPVVFSSSWSEIDVVILAGTIGHVLSLGASSFIEEEHQTWYFLINTLCLMLCQELCRNNFLLKQCDPQHSTTVKHTFDSIGEASEYKNIDIPAAGIGHSELGKTTSSAEYLRGSDKWISLASPWIILICCRLLRSLNQTGIQWAHRPDFGHWLTSSEHKAELSFLAAVSLFMIFFLVQRRCSLVSKIAMALGLLGVYSYRAAIGNVVFPWQHDSKDISKGITEARFVYVFVLGIVFTGTKDLLKSQVVSADSSLKTTGLCEVYSGLVLLAALLFRPHNLPVLVFCLLIQTMMTKYIWRPLKFDAAQITIMHYWFGQAFFYFQGPLKKYISISEELANSLLQICLTVCLKKQGKFKWHCYCGCFSRFCGTRKLCGDTSYFPYSICNICRTFALGHSSAVLLEF
ncbi:GPI ethanolamine phosphate transferase 2 isoform X3 [Athene cunicularia]|uniref:GPI ethanolamine phosphate transferase 2 isoform X3 n=1 Tax=Athene cunicularia TaxID=194338 RepID=UPI000EF740EA|nr:GPI ethanolamine phosphate transferase 2 isoform X3 [Athene cunicularia]XP_026721882.1 GPI ethanolamine phosphate transferase 2 isoform X3 [Athene cunicularia]XP_026721883.1 GPI ethanolamine phosphate transferase 2 isoform X3 [Athene cunicularia]